MSKPVMIEADGLSKQFGPFLAVRDVTFSIPKGEIVAFLGPNGAGKTTTMRALAGIIRPTRGRLSIAGHDVVHDSIAAKRALAYIPDDPKLFDALTVWEHLEFIASAYRVDDFVPKGEALLAQFELVEKRRELAQTLSRGMRQKVAICCAYLHDPKAILFDEPLTGLDPYAIRTLKASIADRAAAGAAVVVSSHLLVLVEDLCTHLLILNKGHRLFYGSLDEARSKYAGLQADGGVASLEDVFFRATETPSRP
jgi:ABC-2 type transport system ATP-binding protein